ncbi:Mu transposase C-terminal domain-containing protein [Desulfosporosinus shakirovi]|uniref:Mu transposase C-terminal domain-containing protein n=1 Tax=Desulfosporosinus shakirovi TaxID=2885154 RepID=UPI001E40E7B1|nr:Mu transposase C-terminal domain-containing protein [Desulfosporosinus sp. SRJS8]MCB8818876.1 Mu transposase C-terminal domain-containing protein [Desulfosporosinus sp. SRJS8]
MNSVKIVPGIRFKIDQEPYIILKLLDGSIIQVLNEGYQKTELLKKSEMIKMLSEGRLEFEVKGKNIRPSEEGSFSTKYKEDFLEAVDRKDEAIFRIKVIKPLLKCRTSRKDISNRVDEINQLFDNPRRAEEVLGTSFIKKVSVPSVYRWIAMYRESGGDIRSLIPGYKNSGGLGKSRIHSKTFDFIRESIQEVYLQQQRITIEELHYIIIAKVADFNEYRKEHDKLKLPAYSTLARIISRIPEFELVSSRKSPRDAEVSYEPLGSGVKVEYPLERVEMDATIIDLNVIFADGTYKERPYFVPALDKKTRNILGFSLGFGGVGWPEVSQCLYHVLSDKSYVKEKYPFIINEWNAFGVPGSIVVDNGLEFKNIPMKDACYQLGVGLEFAPPRTPEWKGSIERFFGTSATNFIQLIPGTTRSNPRQLAQGEKPKEVPGIPFNIFIGLLHKWIIDVYTQDLNKGAGGIPAKIWEKLTDDYPVDWPNSTHELPILLGRIKERTITNQGIELKILHYNSNELNHILKKFSKDNRGAENKFTVKYDPQNLGYIYLFDHLFNREWIKVPCTSPEYANGLSEWEHDEARKLSMKELGQVDIISLAKAKVFLRQQNELWTSKNNQGKAAKLNSNQEIFGESTKALNDREVKIDYRLPEIPECHENEYLNVSDVGTEIGTTENLPPLPVSIRIIEMDGEAKSINRKGKRSEKKTNARTQTNVEKPSILRNSSDLDELTTEDLFGFEVIKR